ncbi:TRAP transporter small permease [Halalkalibacter oceani]|uniref:TRAP transporter small permease n=1 Tax=Halalkalibacter oceani TaxID=1653776 RepID=A0A9X2IPL3_9BACI|nr:TRAP transporter small permease [Halalkalibacter oceani]MCM3715370.1 TRAP transporter small permease [Halalkalibacter oceani]
MKWLNWVEDGLISICMLVAAILILCNVVLRMFGYGISWTEELVRYLIVWLTFVGSSVCIRQGMHISVDFIMHILTNSWVKKTLTICLSLIAILFSLLFTYFAFKFFLHSFQSNQRSPSLNIPISYIFIVLPLSGLLMFFRYSQQLFLDVVRN